MPNGHGSFAEPFHNGGGKYIVDKPCVLVVGKYAVVVDHNTAGLLAAVLKGKQAIVTSGCRIGHFGGIYPEHTAFFSEFVHWCAHFHPNTRFIIS